MRPALGVGLFLTLSLLLGHATYPEAAGQAAVQEQSIPPGAKADFTFRICPPGQPYCIVLGFTVQSRANDPFLARFDPNVGVLTLQAPAGFALQVSGNCGTLDGPVDVFQCSPGGSSPPVGAITVTTIVGATGIGEFVLARGCNNVTVTQPGTTATADLARVVRPPDRLAALWKYDAERGRFLGYAPGGGAANDLAAVQRLEAIFICMTEVGSWRRPIE